MAQPPKPKPHNATTPKRPANLPQGRWLGDLEPLSAAEKALVKACAEGRVWCPNGWDGKSRPEQGDATNTIRGELIRFIALGGDALNPVNEEGVMVRGAWVNGTLTVHQARAAVRLALFHCHFAAEPDFTAAHLPELALIGSAVPGLWADGLIVTGSVYLREGFEATGSVRLVGAQIGGDLNCTNSRFTNEDGDALCADGIKVTGGVYLGDGFEAMGSVRLLGAEIGGNLEFDGANLSSKRGTALHADSMSVKGSLFLRNRFSASGEVRLLGAQIGDVFDCGGGSFTNENGDAFSADRIKVTGSLFLRSPLIATGTVRLLGAEIGGDLNCIGGSFTKKGGYALNFSNIRVTGNLFLSDAGIEGAVHLAAARVGTLIDDLLSWKAGGHIFDGLSYGRIIGPTDARSRIAWLKLQRADHLTTDFKPQPWDQLIKALREMGQHFDAEEVAIAKQHQLRVAGKIEGPLRWFLHWLYGTMTGYGHRPINILKGILYVWLACAVLFSIGRDWGYFGPSNPLIHASAAFEDCGAPGENKWFWTSADCPTPPEYSTLFPLVYSLDLILPLVDLQQDADWAPIVVNSNGEQLLAGHALRLLMWFEILFGWAASLMLVAVLGRLVEKD